MGRERETGREERKIERDREREEISGKGKEEVVG